MVGSTAKICLLHKNHNILPEYRKIIHIVKIRKKYFLYIKFGVPLEKASIFIFMHS